ncbi:MAG TPA: hypothetical protein PLZ55_19920, partial [bacterium]|nr:hypothetical protein [bacterium]
GSYQIRVRQVNPGEYLPLERSFTPKKYRPGERISVTLQSARYADTAVNTSFNYVYEIIPPGWAAENISHGGMFLRRAIFWRLASPDSSLRQVCYDLVAPSDGSGTCEFRESFYVLFVDGIPVDALSIAGETSLMENTDTGVENWSRHAE